ncbi:MAG: mevalonate kinase [Anaerolineales bacterium]
MPAISASAPGKVILFGEHAVVYGQPAIAVPVHAVAAKASISPDITAPKGRIRIQATDIGIDSDLDQLPKDHPLSAAVWATLQALAIHEPPAFRLRINSTIPFGGGLGSGAAVTVAIIRALSAFLGHPLPNDRVSALTFNIEKLHHGTPSGIDNTVISYEKPVFFVKDKPIEMLRPAAQFSLLIADTGMSTPTKITVTDVGKGWQKEPQRYEKLFTEIGAIAQQARSAIEGGNPDQLGPLMNANHELLQQLDVSSAELDALVAAAKAAGAGGAKLSGGGRGGHIIALVTQNKLAAVKAALLAAGGKGLIVTTVKRTT